MTITNISFAPVLPAYNANHDHSTIISCVELQDQMLQATMANFQNSENRMVGVRIKMKAGDGSIVTRPALFFGYNDDTVSNTTDGTHRITAYFLVKIGSQYAVVASIPTYLNDKTMSAFTYQNRDTCDWQECFDVANRVTADILGEVVEEDYRIVDATKVEDCVRSALTFINEI